MIDAEIEGGRLDNGGDEKTGCHEKKWRVGLIQHILLAQVDEPVNHKDERCDEQEESEKV
jgi:hypothetical protein